MPDAPLLTSAQPRAHVAGGRTLIDPPAALPPPPVAGGYRVQPRDDGGAILHTPTGDACPFASLALARQTAAALSGAQL